MGIETRTPHFTVRVSNHSFLTTLFNQIKCANTVKADQAPGAFTYQLTCVVRYRIIMLCNNGYTSEGIFKLP